MKAFLLTAPNRLELRDIPMPVLKSTDVLIKVKMLGVCGTDVSVYKGQYAAKENVILGHEFCGEVAAVGAEVFTCKAGDFVASAASSGCGKCRWCLEGKPSYCDNAQSLGRLVDGALAEYIAVDQRMIYHLLPGTSLAEGQGLVGVSTALRAVKRAGVPMGGSVIVIGPGYSGLQIMQLMKMQGCHVTVVGTRKPRLDLALSLGADAVANIRENPDWEGAVDNADCCIEAAGTLSSLQACMRKVKKGGVIVQFGTSRDAIADIPQKDYYYKEITLVGSKGGYGCYEQALSLLGRHRVKVEPLVTHVFPFEKAPEAFDMMDRRLDNVIRAAIRFD